MYTMGIDVGSASSKAVILRDGREVVAGLAVQAGTGSSGPGRVLEEITAKSGLDLKDMAFILATGYGRTALPMADKQMSEITCHAKGVFFEESAARTIIDIGGQDVKAIALDDRGGIRQFYMNDKCAAGTGRFLEVMARVLEVPLEEMGEYHFRSKNPAQVSSTCTVFAESEVISLIADNHSAADIVHGLNRSVAVKTAALVQRAGGCGPYLMTGGVARNQGVVQALEERLGAPLGIGDTPDLCGALGAALFALDHVTDKGGPA